MPKITFIGAGSTIFAKRLMADILLFPELANSEIALYDINAERLATSEGVGRRLIEKTGAKPNLWSTTDRRAALEGADYAITMFQIGGYEPGTTTDFEVPRRFGVRQTIGDTLGIGGIMRALRTIPVLLDMCHDMEAVCPGVVLLQYANPMAMLMTAVARASHIQAVGLCHSVQHTAELLARDIGVPQDEINYLGAGINHVAFLLRLERNGEDLYPLVRRVIDEGRVPDDNRVRYDLFKRLGYFVTESSEHFSEYVPWYIKQNQPNLIEQYNIPLDEYLHRSQLQIKLWELMNAKIEQPQIDQSDALTTIVDDAPVTPGMRRAMMKTYTGLGDESLTQSDEYGARIIHSIETGTPRVIYGNVPNTLGLISNLPRECCVEVPCLVDANGIQPTAVGALPPQLAALMQTNINVQQLTVEAALTGKREHVYHAAMFDPHLAAELSLDQIWALVDDLIDAHGDWMPPLS